MFLIVGLGNPGTQYEKTRHNIGFMAVDEIVRRFSFSSWSEKFSGLMTKGTIDGHKVVLLKPQTFMNLSGQSVQLAAQFFKIDVKNMIVIHDDLDLIPLKIRIKTGGGNGGHNGLKSIQQCMGSADFIRLRLGIGHPGDKNKVTSYVLHGFSSSEAVDFDILCRLIADKIPLILDGKEQRMMSDIAQFFAPQK